MGKYVLVSFDNADYASASNDMGGASWGKTFSNHLGKLLYQFSKGAVDVVPSDELNKGELQNKTNKEIFTNVAAMVCVLSNNSVNSETLHSHLTAYQQLGSEDTLYKVSIEPLTNTLGSLENLADYKFFDVHPESKEVILLEGKNYWLKMVDLAYDILESVSGSTLNKNLPREKTVFLAETTVDQEHYRDEVRRELTSRGYQVLPHKPLPKTYAELENTLIELLNKSTMSIHIMGETYGSILGDTGKSIVAIQNKIAADFSQRHEGSKDAFDRLIWLSPDLKLIDETQYKYIEEVKHDKDLLIGAEIHQTPIESLKSSIISRLELMENIKANISNGKQTKIYLISDKKDNSESKQLAEFIKKNGFDLLETSLEEKEDLVKQHRRNLVNCDATVIFYGHENKEWINTKLKDLLKAPGFGRKKPMTGKVLLSTVKNSLIDQDVDISNLTIIENTEQFQPETLSPFLEKIK